MPRAIRSDLSRYRFYLPTTDAQGNAVTPDVEPYPYEDREDSIPHIAVAGDTWESLALYRYWDISVDADQLGYVIQDFQPLRPLSPFAPIMPGTLVVIPSPTFVTSVILASPVEVFQ